MEKHNKTILYTMGILLIIVLFCASFIWTISMLGNPSSEIEGGDVAVTSGNYDNISSDTKIVLKVKDEDGHETEEKVLQFKDIADDIDEPKDADALQAYFQKENYYLKPTGDDTLVFVRKKFTPGVYYIGVKDKDGKEYLAIYKADEEGKLFIEDESTDIVNFTLDNIPNNDEKNLYRNVYCGEDGKGFATKEDAIELLTSFNIK